MPAVTGRIRRDNKVELDFNRPILIEVVETKGAKVEKTIIAENIFSNGLEIYGYFNLSISGISGDTVWVQRSFDKGATWKDVKSYTSNIEEVGRETERGVFYRFGVKAGGYSAGTIVCRLSF